MITETPKIPHCTAYLSTDSSHCNLQTPRNSGTTLGTPCVLARASLAVAHIIPAPAAKC
ncbi:unnamed protein product [Coffea canephora]|uniref:Uncharacterized protein n=1 Tax=Coffea canephora TaxID=49390 RepID=A0A068TTF3_COFCA|nr:unnamed protein product [Coffea canephora]